MSRAPEEIIRTVTFARLLLIAAIAAAGTLAGCGNDQLVQSAADLAFDRPSLEVGKTWPGGVIEAKAILQNRGRVPLQLTWELPSRPWEFSELPSSLDPGQVDVSFRVQGKEVGTFSAKLVVRSGTDISATLDLSVVVDPIPSCGQPSTCQQLTFDVAQGKCVETQLEDGVACDPGTVCVLDAVCKAGHCEGTPRSCEDGNACTINACDPLAGCQFPPAPPCPGDDSCQMGVCDPQTGCGLAPMPDGEKCGDGTCDAARICISGQCAVRDPPDGYVCEEASPCQDKGVCQGSTCVQPPPHPIAPSWWFSSETANPQRFLHDFVVSPDGDLTLMGFYRHPFLRANRTNGVELDSVARRCIDWNGKLACADYEVMGDWNGHLALIDPATSQPLWIFRLATARPDFDADTRELFMARISSQGSDRLAALFEGYPADAPPVENGETLCRNYYLVILDARGRMVSAKKIEHPFLEVCNHPHPFGVASDRLGNIYLSFSPGPGSTPLVAQSPTLFMSYSRDGVLRWTHQEDQVGGEIAVARGVVFPENSEFPLNAATGEKIPLSTNQVRGLGRIVGASDRFITGPRGVDFGAYQYDGTNEWQFLLPPGETFISSELRAISWTPPRPTARTQQAVLSFSRSLTENLITAVRTSDGHPLWSCPVDHPFIGEPALFEVSNNGLAAMTNATTGEGDPPFALSNASFWTFDLPGVSPGIVPWPGTFGGPNHDHLEDGQ